jgi:hypothetical protein
MKYPALLVPLAAPISAIDFWLHFGEACNGNALVHLDNKPDVRPPSSLSPPVSHLPLRLLARYPPSWHISARAFAPTPSETCSSENAAAEGSVWGGTSICLTNGGFIAGQYSFVGGKRRGLDGEGMTEGKKECQTRRPDMFVLEDGRKFDITGMDDEKLDELIAMAANGTDVEEALMGFEKVE